MLFVCPFHFRSYELCWDRGKKCHFNVSFWCGEETNDPISENVLVLMFRLVWKSQKTETEVEKKITWKTLDWKC